MKASSACTSSSSTPVQTSPRLPCNFDGEPAKQQKASPAAQAAGLVEAGGRDTVQPAAVPAILKQAIDQVYQSLANAVVLGWSSDKQQAELAAAGCSSEQLEMLGVGIKAAALAAQTAATLAVMASKDPDGLCQAGKVMAGDQQVTAHVAACQAAWDQVAEVEKLMQDCKMAAEAQMSNQQCYGDAVEKQKCILERAEAGLYQHQRAEKRAWRTYILGLRYDNPEGRQQQMASKGGWQSKLHCALSSAWELQAMKHRIQTEAIKKSHETPDYHRTLADMVKARRHQQSKSAVGAPAGDEAYEWKQLCKEQNMWRRLMNLHTLVSYRIPPFDLAVSSTERALAVACGLPWLWRKQSQLQQLEDDMFPELEEGASRLNKVSRLMLQRMNSSKRHRSNTHPLKHPVHSSHEAARLQLLVHSVRFTLAASDRYCELRGKALTGQLRSNITPQALGQGDSLDARGTACRWLRTLADKLLLLLPGGKASAREKDLKHQLRTDRKAGSYQQQLRAYSTSPYLGLEDMLREELQHSRSSDRLRRAWLDDGDPSSSISGSSNTHRGISSRTSLTPLTAEALQSLAQAAAPGMGVEGAVKAAPNAPSVRVRRQMVQVRAP